ncbi:hypothetical protein JXB31_05580 [Candidatus Woesearchaeota archaeon]|nr:hypothetical protein [Candidatus Woesearchaeota archaeon]
MSTLPNLTPFFHAFDSWLKYIYQLDVTFDFLILIIAGLIGFYSYKVYRFTTKRNYLLFCISFLFIALGYSVKTGFDILVQTESLRSEVFFGLIGFPVLSKLFMLSYMMLVLIGYVIMIVISMRGNRKTALLFMLLLVVSLFLSQSFFLTFSLSSIILLSFLLYHFNKNFSIKRTLNSGMVWYAFLLLTISHIVSLFIIYSNKFYLLSNIMMMGAFLLLLLNYVMVLRK